MDMAVHPAPKPRSGARNAQKSLFHGVQISKMHLLRNVLDGSVRRHTQRAISYQSKAEKAGQKLNEVQLLPTNSESVSISSTCQEKNNCPFLFGQVGKPENPPFSYLPRHLRASLSRSEKMVPTWPLT